MKKYRVWLEDSWEDDGGLWWECYLGTDGKLHDYIYTDEQADTPEWYIEHGSIVEELCI